MSCNLLAPELNNPGFIARNVSWCAYEHFGVCNLLLSDRQEMAKLNLGLSSPVLPNVPGYPWVCQRPHFSEGIPY